MSTSPSNIPSVGAASIQEGHGATRGGLSPSELSRQFRALPALLRWALLATVAVGVYVLFNATTWNWARQTGSTAATLQSELNKANRQSVLDDPRLRGVVLAYGAIRLPPREDEGSLALAEAVNEVLKSHRGAEKVSDQAQAASRLQGASLTQILPRGAEGARVTREIEFIAPPHVASAVLMDLESHPAIDAISRIEMQAGDRKDRDARLLKVKLTVEAWVAGEARGRRG